MKATNTSSHLKAENLLRKLNFTPFRQFEPKATHALGKGEMFEVWSSPTNKLVFVHFYEDNHGFEVYAPVTSSNLMSATEEALAKL